MAHLIESQSPLMCSLLFCFIFLRMRKQIFAHLAQSLKFYLIAQETLKKDLKRFGRVHGSQSVYIECKTYIVDTVPRQLLCTLSIVSFQTCGT